MELVADDESARPAPIVGKRQRQRETTEIVAEAIAFKGVAVVIFEAPCIALYKPKIKMKINERAKQAGPDEAPG